MFLKRSTAISCLDEEVTNHRTISTVALARSQRQIKVSESLINECFLDVAYIRSAIFRDIYRILKTMSSVNCYVSPSLFSNHSESNQENGIKIYITNKIVLSSRLTKIEWDDLSEMICTHSVSCCKLILQASIECILNEIFPFHFSVLSIEFLCFFNPILIRLSKEKNGMPTLENKIMSEKMDDKDILYIKEYYPKYNSLLMTFQELGKKINEDDGKNLIVL